MTRAPQRRASKGINLSWTAVVILIPLAALGAVTLLQWVFLHLFGLIRWVLAMIVLVALAAWAIKAKAKANR